MQDEAQDQGHFQDLLDQLERDVLDMERTGATAIVHLLFRTAHNLKSSTAQAGFATLSRQVHELEDALDRVRRGKEPWSTACFDKVTGVVDLARLTILGEATRGGQGPAEAGTAPGGPPAGGPPPGRQRWGLDLSAEELAACDRAEADGLGLFRIEKLFRKGLDRETFLSLPVMEDVRELGTLIAVEPTWETYHQGPDEQVVKILFASPKTETGLAAILFDPLIVLREPKAPEPGPRTEPLRFLIIEDDPTAGGLLQYILRQHGECRLCETGQDGLAAFHEGLDQGRPFDLVVLDLFLPDLHGNTVLKAIRAEESQRDLREPGSRCLVLINTASKDIDQMRQSLEQEPDGYLIKPINVDFLLAKIADLKAQRLPSA